MATVEEAAARMMDMAQPLDVTLFEQLVSAAYEPGNPQQANASRCLVQLQEHPGQDLSRVTRLSVLISHGHAKASYMVVLTLQPTILSALKVFILCLHVIVSSPRTKVTLYSRYSFFFYQTVTFTFHS